MHEAFDSLYTSDKRYFFLTGGRGSLKSSNVHEFVGNLCRFQKGHGVLFTRYTMTSAEKSIIPEFKAVAKRCGFEHEFDFTKNVVTHKETGSFIFFSGIKTSSGDQTANLKSISGITTWVIEEGEDLKDEKTFETIDDSIRTLTHQNRVIWIMNPTTEEHFIYKKWIAPKSRMIEIDGFNVTVSALPEVEHIHVTYEIGREYLAPDWLAKADRYKKEAFERDALKEDHPRYQPLHKSHYYHNYIGGWLDKAEGVIFDKWKEGAFDYSLPYLYGLDLGYFPDPSAQVAVAVDERLKRIYLKEELYQTELSTSELKAKVKERLRRVNDYVISEIEPMTVKEIKQHGVNIKQATKGADSVRIGIRKMQGYEIIVDPDSENLKTELNNYVWNDKKSDTPIDNYNHLIDAARYGFMELTTKPKGKKRRATTI